MNAIQQLLTEHIGIWTAADTEKKTGRGRSSGNAVSVYGIRKLRELILELAVRGKLVPQDANDEPASALLKRIQAEKAKLIAEGKIKKEKPLPPITENEKPFELPQGWVWTRVAHIGHDWGQKTPDSDFTYIEVSAINSLRGIVSSPELVTPENAPSRARKMVKRGSVIYSTIRPYLLNIAVIEENFLPEPIASTAFAVVHPFCLMPPRYFLCFFRSPVFVRYVESVQMGIAYPAINDSQFFSGLISLPPLAEQHRIVAKVDELMSLCDQLETRHNNAAEAHEKLVSHLLATLTQSQKADSPLSKRGAGGDLDWRRIAAHFDTLFTTEASIDALKQTLLQLAVMGKLVPQVPNDEPASALLKRIQAEKARMIAEGKIKKDKPLPEIAEDEKPYDLQQGWAHIRLAEIINVSSGDGLTAENMDKAGDIPVFGGNGVTGYHSQSNTEEQTLVIGRVGFYCGSVHLTPSRAWITDNALRVKYSQNNLDINFLYWLLKATNLKENESATAQPLVTGRKIYPIVTGLPPLAEQHRIVAKVDELMALCDQLKTRITAANQLQQKLADVVVEQAIA